MIAVIIAALSSVAAPSDFEGEDRKRLLYDLPPAVAIQPRKYEMKHSLMATSGYIPTDSFNRGYTFAAAYRYGIAKYLTWDVLSFTHVVNQETQLKNDIQKLNIVVTNVGLGGVLDYPRQIYMTGLHYAPMYSKSLLFNRVLTYSETSLFLGVGSINFNKVGYKPMVVPGLSARFYVSTSSAVTAHFRDYFYQDDNTGITGIMDFGIGFEFKFGGGAPAQGSEDDD